MDLLYDIDDDDDDDECGKMLKLLFDSDDDDAEFHVVGPVVAWAPNIEQNWEAAVLRLMITSAQVRRIRNTFFLVVFAWLDDYSRAYASASRKSMSTVSSTKTPRKNPVV